MPPRTYRDLTPEQLAELDELITPRAPVPRLAIGATASSEPTWSGDVTLGDARFTDAPPSQIRDDLLQMEIGGEEPDEAWLDSLIASPPQAPRALSAAGPSGVTYEGVDTPQGREFVKQRGMQVTSTPTDDDLLEALSSQRPATMPELGGEDELDELIRAESAAMDREQSASGVNWGGGYSAPPRRSREDALREMLQPPTRAQGGLALLFDALLGTKTLDNVNARQRSYEGAMAQARMQDVAAGERSDERAADREMTDARLGVTLRGQDLADARAAESRTAAERRAEQADKRIREENALGRDAAMERARIMAQSRARGEAPALSPQEESAGVSGFLQQQANVSEAEASAYLAGKTEGISPAKLERLRANHSQLKTLSPQQRGDVIKTGLGRTGGTLDREEPARLEARNSLLAQHAAIKEASEAWAAMSPKARQVVARVGGGDSTAASLARSAMLDEADQARAAKIQALANALIKAQSGASVTANEWRRVATEIGLPQDAVSLFNSPASIDAWLKKSRDGFRAVRNSTLQTYKGLFDDMEQP
jgi:hypothetical protein